MIITTATKTPQKTLKQPLRFSSSVCRFLLNPSINLQPPIYIIAEYEEMTSKFHKYENLCNIINAYGDLCESSSYLCGRINTKLLLLLTMINNWNIILAEIYDIEKD